VLNILTVGCQRENVHGYYRPVTVTCCDVGAAPVAGL